MSNEPTSKMGIGCAVLFALPFAGFGCFMAWLVGSTLIEWQQTQTWVETPAEILAVELIRHAGDGDDSFEATARYAYQFAGRRFEGDRVSIHSGADNIGDFHRDVDAELREFLAQKRPFTCFVNPSRPSEAVLYRDLRYGLIAFETSFALIFGGIGFGLWAWMWYANRKQKKVQTRRNQFPDQPWRHREDWAAGVIRNNHGIAQIATWTFAVLWNGISWPATFAMFTDDANAPAWAIAIGVAFPIIGLCLLGCASYLTLRHLRWGTSQLELANTPGVLGGRLSGVVRLTRNPQPNDGFLVSLTYYERRVEGSGDGESTYEEPLWQAEKRITRTLYESDGKTAIPVDFFIPYDQQESDIDGDRTWKLEVRADVFGLDYHAEFEVPVFRTEASSPDALADDGLLEGYAEPESLASLVARCGGRLQQYSPSLFAIIFPVGRRWPMALTVSFATAFFGMIAVGLLLEGDWFIAPLVALMVLALLYASVWLWLERITLEFGPDGIAVQGGIFGLGKRRLFAPEEIKQIHCGASGERSGTTVYQVIELQLENGKRQKLVGGISRRSNAERLAARIRSAVLEQETP